MASNGDGTVAADALKVQIASSSSSGLASAHAMEQQSVSSGHVNGTDVATRDDTGNTGSVNSGINSIDDAATPTEQNQGLNTTSPAGTNIPILTSANNNNTITLPTGVASTPAAPLITDTDHSTATPTSVPRGGRGGRPRGRGRGISRGSIRRGARGGKRKREDQDEADSESSEEIYTPAAKITKSGRSIQKPSSYVPPPEPSPVSGVKKKRTYRRNPESAVCKMCLRGTSPASNMIVFCDGCNTPYHRYCHHPPIHQSVVDEVDKEWYCKQCESERVVPVPEAEVADFIAAGGASAEQRQRYFASLPPGMLITLLTKATTLKPDLPVFAPDFQARLSVSTTVEQAAANGHTGTTSVIPTQQLPDAVLGASSDMIKASIPSTTMAKTAGAAFPGQNSAMEDEVVPAEHPPTYPRPGYGLMQTLPPEQEDLEYLVDDDDKSGAFTHLYR
ncbi:hypothetical protein LTR78_000780 [Recurvomyces mirabilis]|uniref:PHD-type domain-containing protein n=1 Tax=Recurvomyces mirabilis TaxID=574656 RepID=A0AAE0WWH0_9PEZI|nr:hypothetical protein LTR78_000780 [Recurvomyces mirabilis]KAK5158749.1 hypothetical protein LTS14_002857 [Recurvomyces mirabilis]